MPRHLLPTAGLLAAAAAALGSLGLLARDDAPAASRSSAQADGNEAKSSGPVTATNLRAPAGFEVTLYAGDDLVHDAYCLTIDPDGRVAVSGPGYIRILIDRDADGRADEAVPFANGPKTGAQGLCFDGNDLLAVGDGGLLSYRDADADLRADGPPELLLKLKTGGEHHAHAIRRGPDRLWYLMCGNDTGVTAADVTDLFSPVTDPEAGVLLRFPLDDETGKPGPVAVVADGMRNAYDFDFTAAGDPVTYDSDDEREVSLPWYRPTRVFRLTPGSHAGWISRSWKRPDAFPEMPEVLAGLGRGSPTGVEVYRGTQFPDPYRGAVFVCDWTFGRVVAIPLDPAGRPAEPTPFLTAAGSEGFAPTDLAATPDGTLYVTAGGRGTTGRVYRVRYVEERGEAESPVTRSGASLRSSPGHPGVKLEAVPAALADPDPNTRKAAMHAVHRSPDPTQAKIEHRARALGPAALVRFHLGRLRKNRSVDLPALEVAVPVIEAKATPPDLRYDAVRLAQLALGDVGPSERTPDTFSGYAARPDLSEWDARLDPFRTRLVAAFPTGDAPADEEFVRLLAMLRPDDEHLPARLLDRITFDSHPTADLHHLFALARLPAPRDDKATRRTADALLALDGKLEARRLNRDTYWDERLGDLFAGLADADPALPAAVVRHPDFGRPGHVVFVRKDLRAEAAAALLRKADADPNYRWTPETVELLGASDDPSARDRLRVLYDDPTVRGAALSALADRPDESDRPKFIAGLDDPQIDVVDRCVAALERLSPTGGADEVAALVSALRRLDRDAREYAVRDRVARLLRQVVDGDLGFVFGPKGYRPQPDAIRRWVEYARSLAPPSSPAATGDEWQAVQDALAGATDGDPRRGRALYEAKSCNRCHDGGSVGPDLAGVTGRFSREDLFLAIADPDRDVSSRYRGTTIQTTDGRVLAGLVVYESADGVTLKDGEKTWRVEADQIETRKPMETSLMPRGLLKGLKARDLADLEAYLRTLSR